MSLRYIAASLGLSVTTVSRALAGYSDVAEETRRRVRAEADRIGYAPNAIARRLQKGRTDAIGVVAPTGPDGMADAYVYAAISGVWARLSELDRDLVMLASRSEIDPPAADSRNFRRAIEERRVDGVLLLRTGREDWRIPYLKQAGLPFVIFGARHRDQPDVVAVGVDDEAAADEVLDRLEGFGHDRIALVIPEGALDFVETRVDIFTDRAAKRALELRIVSGAFDEIGGRAATASILAEADHPTALVYFANRMTLGGLRAISDSVLVPGRHVSVISYGDNTNLLYASPPVTAVRAPVEDMIRHAVDLLIGAIERRPIEPIRIWQATLVRRQSDGPLVRRRSDRGDLAGFASLETPMADD